MFKEVVEPETEGYVEILQSMKAQVRNFLISFFLKESNLCFRLAFIIYEKNRWIWRVSLRLFK